MKIVFYGNVLKDNIEDMQTADLEMKRIIAEFLPLGMDIHNTTRKLIMPRAIIKNFPETLDHKSDLYLKFEKLKEYFGDCLIQIDYIPVSGDLQIILKNTDENWFLSNILLAIVGGIGKITIEP